MLRGNDLYYMRKMKDISGVRMQDHIGNYDKIQANMMRLADEAVSAMQGAGKHDKHSKQIAKRAAATN